MLEAAIGEWRAILDDGVVSDGAELARAGRATLAAGRAPRILLRPRARAQAAAVVAVAARHGVALHVVSRGCNWGYGSMRPRDGAEVVLSLQALDAVIAHDEALGCVTLEPGVTFAQLAQFLIARASRFLPPISGTSVMASVVGNALSRGVGKGLYENLADHILALEVLLPDGTSLAISDQAGPVLPGLFTQSALGVVLSLTLALRRAPARRQELFFAADDLIALVDVVRELRQRGGERLQVELLNDYRLLAARRQYPFELHAGEVLPQAWVDGEVRQRFHGRWLGVARRWAESDEELAAAMGALRVELGRVASLLEESPACAGDAPLAAGDVSCAYWRKRTPPPPQPDPDADGCGVIWSSSLLPLSGARVAEIADTVARTMRAHGFEPMLALRPTRAHTVHLIAGLLYDRELPGSDERALACHRQLRAELDGAGVHAYRTGVQDDALPPTPGVALARRLRRALSPER